MRLDVPVPSAAELEKIGDEILKRVPVGPHAHAKAKKWSLYKEGTEIAQKAYEEKGCLQFGTLGRGNHFLELGKDEHGRLWITVHPGSRGFGYAITKEYMTLADIANTDEERYAKEFEEKNRRRERNPEAWEKAKREFVYRRVRARLKTNLEGHFGFDLDGELGQSYLKDVNYSRL